MRPEIRDFRFSTPNLHKPAQLPARVIPGPSGPHRRIAMRTRIIAWFVVGLAVAQWAPLCSGQVVGLGAPPPPSVPASPSPPLPINLFAVSEFESAEQGTPLPEALPLPAHAEVQEQRKFHLEATWDNGLRFESADDRFHVHVGGNAMVDSTWLIAPKGAFALPGDGTNGLENASATFIRRARFRIEGDIYDQFDFIVEYDFANADNDN